MWENKLLVSLQLNSFQLKCVAMITMLTDHIGAILFPEQLALRCIGRISFPIFCFLLVEGFFHTRDIRKYIQRLGLFALISEIPYDLALRGEWLEWKHQNVFFTLCIGVILMYELERCTEWPVKMMELLLAMWFAGILCTDYSYKGILLIAVYYFFRREKWVSLGIGAAWGLLWGEIQSWCIAATPLLAVYNGERGRSLKYFFYGFYPLHLLALYLIRIVLVR